MFRKLGRRHAINARRGYSAVACFLLAIALSLQGSAASGQALSVMPVHVQLATGQKATTLSVTNAGSIETSIQIRAYAWAQPEGQDELAATDVLVVSPPIATIAPGATQTIRLVLRRSPEARESTYRILLDQIPPLAEQGTVRVVLRLSIPVFAQPKTPSISHLAFSLERRANELFLVASNDGVIHEALNDLDLRTKSGQKLDANFRGSQYVLSGATRRWLINSGATLLQGEPLQLKVNSLNGTIQRQVLDAGKP